MNFVASNLTGRKELQRAGQNEKLLKAEGSGNKEVILDKKKKKSKLVIGRSHLALGAGRGLTGILSNQG